jgi:hypothetical protein
MRYACLTINLVSAYISRASCDRSVEEFQHEIEQDNHGHAKVDPALGETVIQLQLLC